MSGNSRTSPRGTRWRHGSDFRRGGLLLGAVIGIISGLIGIGGGAFLIPALIYFYGMSQIKAQGTSLGTLLLPIGGWAGGAWAQHLSPLILQRVFATLLIVLAVKLLATK